MNTSHLFVATTRTGEGTVEIFAGLSIEGLREDGHLDEFDIDRIRQIPDDFYMQVQIGSCLLKDNRDERFFFASPGGAGQGSAAFLAESIDFFGHVCTTENDPFLPLLFDLKEPLS